MMKVVVNVVMYQLIWFLCVLFDTIGAFGGLLIVALHFAVSDRKLEDLRMSAFLLVLGIIVDGTLVQLGFFSFTTPGFPLPFWLVVIWLGLSITPNHSLAWMKNRPLLSLFFGAIGGPAAYWAGVRLGAATFHWEVFPSLALLALVWGILWVTIMNVSLYTESERVNPPADRW